MATLQEIEALSFEQIKADRETLTEALKGEDAAVLASRLVKWLMDAKHRDEKLAEQGKTITALQTGLAAAEERVTRRDGDIGQLQVHLGKAKEELDTIRETAHQTSLADKAALAGAMQSLKAEGEQVLRFRTLATNARQAISGAAKTLNDTLAAFAVDSADHEQE